MSQTIYGKLFEFDEKKHIYYWDKNKVPGVTTILKVINKPALVQWAANMASDLWLSELQKGNQDFHSIHKASKIAHKQKAEKAAGIGTNVHEYAEAILKEQKPPELVTDEAKRGVEAFHKWRDSHEIEVLDSERMIMSQEYYYAGTCDLRIKLDGKKYVGDFKTGSGIYPDMRFQTAAYQWAMEEENPEEKHDGRLIIRFDKKTGEFEVQEFTDLALDFQGFLAALTLHKTLQKIEKGE